MGNEQSVGPESPGLDRQVNVQVQRKPGQIQEGNRQQYEQNPHQNYQQQSNQQQQQQPLPPQQQQQQQQSNELILKEEVVASPKQQQPQNQSHERRKSFSKEDKEDEEEEDDMKPIDILLQFIPYYGQGDPANDSVVRAALSGISIEDIDSKDEYGNSLLLLACQYKCEDLVRIMLNKGADPNAINQSGACCLHFACYRESASLKIVKTLLQNGANPEIREFTYGCTPLHYSAGNGDAEFCKLLLNHGAQIGTVDYYNYTCVDYAREASMTDIASYLQAKLDKFNVQFKSGGISSPANSFYKKVDPREADWHMQIDPVSGGKYYSNSLTGECLWETDYRMRLSSSNPVVAFDDDIGVKQVEDDYEDDDDISQTIKPRLIAFLSKHDPVRLLEVDAICSQYKGNEKDLLVDLCKKYGVAEDPEFKKYSMEFDAMQSAKASLSSANGTTPSSPLMKQKSTFKLSVATDFELGKTTPIASRGTAHTPGGMDPNMVQMLVNEEKEKCQQQLDEERSKTRTAISEKDGTISKLQSQLEALEKDKRRLDDELTAGKEKLSRAQLDCGEALIKAEQEIVNLKKDNSALRDEIATINRNLLYETEKRQSLEETMQNLTLGHEEQISREKRAAEERANTQREREMQHAVELKEQEAKARLIESRLKDDMSKAQNNWKSAESAMQADFSQTIRAKDIEMDSMATEFAEMKAKYTSELSEAMALAADYKKAMDDSLKRAEAAEALQRTMQNEIMEARQVQHFNAQLHKDLAREQKARKILHNEMEDLKGRIRVYVRVRPMSKSEKEKGCSEAVLKDGKQSVLVKLPDSKKNYDFDQVFGGMEGNSQADVFRDTKHLMMSVVDGYNVCIFAYGQTGAGKSYTMIGAADIGNCMSDDGEFDEQAGITPRAVSELFRLLNERHAQITYVLEVQMFQLYRDGLDDLLVNKGKKKKGDDDDDYGAKLKITLAEHSPTGLVQVEGATILTAETPGEVMKIFAKGSQRRTTASTQMNAESSRSHLICCLIVKLTNRRNGSQSVGKLTLVDLAGSERVDKSGAAGEVLKEAQSINKSLSAIGDVISSLTQGSTHIPYRNHTLTMLMSDSIGGNAKTLMFVNTSPADYNYAESNSSLQFASRCKDITNSVNNSGGVAGAQLAALQKELKKMKKNKGNSEQKGLGNPLARPV